MLRRNFSGLMVCIMCLGAASLSLAGQPDHSMSFYATASGTAEVSVFCAPDGGGKALTEAKLEAGGEVDATITLTVNDATGAPIFLYPFEDMWLETSAGGMVPCNGGTTADFSTDINGETTFSAALYAGGYSDRTGGETCIVMVNSAEVDPGNGLPILFNSGDLSKDLQVGLPDITAFVQIYTADPLVYNYAIDFAFDGALNLSDLIFFAGSLNVTCP